MLVYFCHKEDCTKAFKSLLQGRSILKPLKHAGSHRLFPVSITITVIVSYGCTQMPDSLIYGLLHKCYRQLYSKLRFLMAWFMDWYAGSIWSFSCSFQCSSVLSLLHVKNSNPCWYVNHYLNNAPPILGLGLYNRK